MPTSILMELLESGYEERVCTTRSISRTMSEMRLTTVTRRKYLRGSAFSVICYKSVDLKSSAFSGTEVLFVIKVMT